MDIKNELGKIGVRGGHSVVENVLPAKYGYPEYVEGKFVHKLSKKLSDKLKFVNLEPEEEKLKWSVIAKRGRDTGCNTILYNHTNFSVNAKGELNSGVAVIIYPFENEEYKPLYERIASIIAKHMGLPKWDTRIRMSTNYENKNYYSAIHYGMKYGIKHPLIVEYGYHIDVAGREEERINQIMSAYNEMLYYSYEETEINKYNEVSGNTEIDLSEFYNDLFSAAVIIQRLLDTLKKS